MGLKNSVWKIYEALGNSNSSENISEADVKMKSRMTGQHKRLSLTLWLDVRDDSDLKGNLEEYENSVFKNQDLHRCRE